MDERCDMTPEEVIATVRGWGCTLHVLGTGESQDVLVTYGASVPPWPPDVNEAWNRHLPRIRELLAREELERAVVEEAESCFAHVSLPGWEYRPGEPRPCLRCGLPTRFVDPAGHVCHIECP